MTPCATLPRVEECSVEDFTSCPSGGHAHDLEPISYSWVRPLRARRNANVMKSAAEMKGHRKPKAPKA